MNWCYTTFGAKEPLIVMACTCVENSSSSIAEQHCTASVDDPSTDISIDVALRRGYK